jgi:glycerate 2-kinase
VTPLAETARSMFAASLEAVAPDALVRRITFLDDGIEFADAALRPPGALHLVALGKAAPGLAAAVLRCGRRKPDSVFVLTPDGVSTPPSVARFTRYAAHPLPDERGAAATRQLLAALAGCAPEDGIVVLLSGGSSALLAETLPGVPAATFPHLTSALLAAGTPIEELNTVRKHLLAAAGGRLAAASPARLLVLVVSDVPGDDLSSIASGPTVGDPTTFADALAVLERRGVATLFPEIAEFFSQGARGEHAETPKPDDPALRRACTVLLGTSRDALAAAGRAAQRSGMRPCELTRRLRGEARSVGMALAAVAGALVPGEPVALLLAGETTVTVRGSGRGGRNLEVALAAASGLAGMAERCILAAGTDGVDGIAPAAGAVVDGGTLTRAAALGKDAAAALDNNDAWGFFEGLPEAIVTGPTGTNVSDVAFVLAAGGVPDFLTTSRTWANLVPSTPGGVPPACATAPHPEVRRVHSRR